MMRTVFVGVAVALLVLAGCATDEPQAPSELPIPPAWVDAPRVAPGAGRTAAPEAAETGGETPEPQVPAWRVARDGTLGCAEPASLRLLRQGEESAPRLLAEARVAGGCRTTFRMNEWEMIEEDGDLVKMRLLNGPALTLWFLRSDMVAP